MRCFYRFALLGGFGFGMEQVEGFPQRFSQVYVNPSLHQSLPNERQRVRVGV